MSEIVIDHSRISNREDRVYKINTGQILSDLQEKWEEYDQGFLLKEVQNAFVQTLYQKEAFRKMDGSAEAQRQEIQKAKKLYNLELDRISRSEVAFPFPDFFFAKNEGEQQIMDFDASCELGLMDPFFPLFFSLQLSLTDILEVQAFLAYHLENTFQNEPEASVEFLANCIKKYPTVFSALYTAEIGEYTATFQASPLEKEGIKEDAKGKKRSNFNLNRKVLIMHHLFREAGVSRSTTSITEMARLIQGLTDMQPNASDIKNTDIYKRLSNPLKDTSKKGIQDDLIFVRDVFERLGAPQIAQEISKEIHYKD